MDGAVAIFMILMGISIGVVWTRDIASGERIDRSAGWWRAREPGGPLLLPHWIAEYGTAVALITAGAGLAAGAGWGRMLAAVALGALAYTSINSLGWALAEPDRRTYGIPMAVGAVGSLLAVIVLLTG